MVKLVLLFIKTRFRKQEQWYTWRHYLFIFGCRTTLSGDLSSSGVVGPLVEASSLDSFQADLGESGKGI